MTGFDEAWMAVARDRNGEPVSPRLRPLLEAVYYPSIAHPLDSLKLKKSLEDLLLFLVEEGRSVTSPARAVRQVPETLQRISGRGETEARKSLI